MSFKDKKLTNVINQTSNQAETPNLKASSDNLTYEATNTQPSQSTTKQENNNINKNNYLYFKAF